MKVYRVENVDKVGPYTARNTPTFWNVMNMLNGEWPDPEYHTDKDGHPEPMQDGIEGRFGDLYVSGFINETQMHKWFNPDEMNALLEHGYHVATYDVPKAEVKRGYHQCAFKKIYLNVTKDHLSELFEAYGV